VVLDPFFGAGTTGLVAQKHGRRCVGIEINSAYVEIARRRLGLVDPEVMEMLS
jgi:site-specific DNA-methyltransferase (adenine-specific)